MPPLVVAKCICSTLKMTQQHFIFSLQVSSLGREVSDLGQLMRRMVQLMENLLPSVPPLPHLHPLPRPLPRPHSHPQPYAEPPRSYPSPSHGGSHWAASPSCSSLPSSPATCNRTFLLHRPQDLQPAGTGSSVPLDLPTCPSHLGSPQNLQHSKTGCGGTSPQTFQHPAGRL